MADTDSSSPKRISAAAALIQYLSERDDVFRELHQLKIDGLKNPKADEHFAAQRNRADTADAKQSKRFYDMMKQVAQELNTATGALNIKPSAARNTTTPPMILDLCMAPGGFSAAALAANPTAQLCAITLPPSQGGHPVFLPLDNPRTTVQYLDITLLTNPMGVPAHSIPASHPDSPNFIHSPPFPSTPTFDLVFCDGQVLRTHSPHRPAYRERREATRLLTSQLVLAFSRMREGGTLVVLLHRVEEWRTARLLQTVSRVADVRLFKPRRAWGMRGSFYLVAENVRPRGGEAERAVEGWKWMWRGATFGDGLGAVAGLDGGGDGVDDGGEDEEEGEDEVADLLREFGETLVRMGRPVWRIQLEALRRAPWNRGENGEAGHDRRGAWRS